VVKCKIQTTILDLHKLSCG